MIGNRLWAFVSWMINLYPRIMFLGIKKWNFNPFLKKGGI